MAVSLVEKARSGSDAGCGGDQATGRQPVHHHRKRFLQAADAEVEGVGEGAREAGAEAERVADS
jgi:hypothetical protein